MPFLREDLQLRAVAGRAQAVGGDVVDRFLAFFHAGLVVGKAHAHRVGGGAGVAQQSGQLLAVGEVFAQAFLEHRAEFGVEGRVLARVLRGGGFVFLTHHVGHAVGAFCGGWRLVLLRQIFQHGQHAAGVALADGLHVAAFLQQLAADVERQVGRVDHALDPAQVRRHQAFGLVHDEDALDVELDARLVVAVPEVHRRLGRDEQQLRVLGAALHPVVAPGQRRLLVVAEVLVELGVLLVADVFLGARPQGVGRVHGFPLVLLHVLAFFGVPFFLLHQDGQADVVGVLGDQRLELPVAQVLTRVVAQVQGHAGAARGALDGLDLELARAAADPAHALAGRQCRRGGFPP